MDLEQTPDAFNGHKEKAHYVPAAIDATESPITYSRLKEIPLKLYFSCSLCGVHRVNGSRKRCVTNLQ